MNEYSNTDIIEERDFNTKYQSNVVLKNGIVMSYQTERSDRGPGEKRKSVPAAPSRANQNQLIPTKYFAISSRKNSHDEQMEVYKNSARRHSTNRNEATKRD